MTNAVTQASPRAEARIEPPIPAKPARTALELVSSSASAADSEHRKRAAAASRRANNRRAVAADQALLVPGLTYGAELLTREEERALIVRLAGLDLRSVRNSRGSGTPRGVDFGWHCEFEQTGFGPADPLPDFLLTLRRRVADFSGTPADRWEQASVTIGAPGTAEWLQERPVFEQLVELTLGGAAKLRLRQRASEGFDRRSLPLEQRSAYRIADEARHGWERRVDGAAAPGWAIRFRTLSQRGLRR